MSADAIRQKLLGRFREVARDRANRLAGALLRVESTPSEEILDELRRELHTLKGESRMMGYVGISRLVHVAEDLLEQELVAERLQGLRRACEAIPLLLEAPPEGGPSGASLLADLQAFEHGGGEVGEPNVAEQVGEAEPATEPATEVVARAEPAAEKPAQPSAPTNGARQPEPQAQAQAPISIHVDLDALDEIAGLTGDILVEGARSAARTHELKRLLDGWNDVGDRLLRLLEGHGTTDQKQATIAIEDDIHRLRTRAFRFFHHHAVSVGGVQQLLGTLAERVAGARLIPLGQLFVDLPDTAAALAREQGKEVQVEISGGETGIDKAILPSLQDPLIHLLRNSIDHGFETPDERRQLGKAPAGLLRVRAVPDGDRLQVLLEDDGRGIDPERIRDTAVRRGVLDAAAAASLPDRAALDLIFAPGFSTRARAGETSGRGVGLDVVRRRVVSLGGSVTVDSQPGLGTRFPQRLPQSHSLVKVLLLRIDDDVYGLPAADVEGVGRLDPATVTEVAGVRMVPHRDRLVPVVPAGPLFALNGGPSSKRPAVAFLEHGGQGLALVVDGFSGEREVAVKPPGAFLQGRSFVSGSAALEDGRVALLLSTAEIFGAARRRHSLPERRSRLRKRVLLVDDSLIAREAEAALLRALGHEVDEAADGEEGFRKLQAGRYDLLVTDVQMPVLDGIDLTRRVKATPELRKIPVLILSSLESQQDRRRGLEAGAEGYLGKRELDGPRLARLVEQLCGGDP